MMRYPRNTLAATFVIVLFGACDSKPESPPPAARKPWPHPEVVITRHVIDSEAPPANPVDGIATPSELNKAVFLRIRHKNEVPVQAILVLMPGFLGSANDFLYVGERLVERSEGKIEVWAIDRRGNLMEDRRGFAAAQAAGDPQIAEDYYFGVDWHGVKAIDGKTFEGLKKDSQLSFMSEWGVDMHLRDVMAILKLIPEADRKAHVFFGGHSLGGYLAERFAGWDFDGDVSTTADAGFNQIAGLVLIDGGGDSKANLTPAEWHDGYTLFGFPLQGIDEMRGSDGRRVMSLGPLDNKLYLVIELMGLYDWFMPKALSHMFQVTPSFNLVAKLLFGTDKFRATNEAMFGFAVDNNSQPIPILQISAGRPAGGPLKPGSFSIEGFGTNNTLQLPADSTSLYEWTPWNQVGEITDLHTFARMTFYGEANFIDWYFPNRLSLDFSTLTDLATPVSEGTAATEARLHFAHLRKVDAPVFAVAAGKGIRTTLQAYDGLKALLPPARGKTGPRGEDDFKVMIDPAFTHLDVLTADDEAAPNAYFKPLTEWLLGHTQGGIEVPKIP